MQDALVVLKNTIDTLQSSVNNIEDEINNKLISVTGSYVGNNQRQLIITYNQQKIRTPILCIITPDRTTVGAAYGGNIAYGNTSFNTFYSQNQGYSTIFQDATFNTSENQIIFENTNVGNNNYIGVTYNYLLIGL